MKSVRKIVFYKNYFDDFFEPLAENVKGKIDEVLILITVLERIPTKFFKSITGAKGLYEIRVKYESNIYRIFCCFDEGKLVVLFNGFHKKTQKTPPKELNKAIFLMEEYLTREKDDRNGIKR